MVARVRHRSLLLGFLVLLLVPAVAFAASFGVTVAPIVDTVERGESATYRVSISNFGVDEAQFQVYTIDPTWAVKVTPLGPLVPAQSQGTFTISLRPSTQAPSGAQGVPVTFKDLTTGTIIKRDVVVTLRGGNSQGLEYEPTVALDVVLPYDVDPREQVPLRLNLRNRNALNITNLTLRISSPQFQTELALALPPLSERTVDVPGIRIDARTPPGEQDVSVRALYRGETVAQLEKNYRISSYSTISEQVQERSFAFKTIRSVRITNDGNVQNTAVVSVPTSLLKSLFVSSATAYERELVDGHRALVWRVPLGAGETREVEFTENYRVLVLLALVLILCAVGYVFLRSPIIVLKEAVGLAKHDGVSQVKVRLFIKNRSSRIIQGISVTDRVPSIADVVRAETPGSISPSKVAMSEKGGTLLRWDLEVLEPYEERVVTYVARSKLKIIGRMTLPVAKTRYTVNGKERVIHSNNIEIVERFKDR